jgi:CysZ protein
MVIQSAFAAWRQVLSPAFRGILWKSLALTIALLALVWFGLTRLLSVYLAGHDLSADYPIVDTFAFVLAGAGLFVALAYLMPPISALVAGYFLDDAAEIVERSDFPGETPGTPLSLGRALLYGARFAGLSLLVNLAALILIFIPVVNIAAFFAANAYLLSREYFELAAGRFRSMPEAARMRREHRGTVLMAGALLAGLVLVPVLNLLTPLFGVALMVHLHKRLSRRALSRGERDLGGVRERSPRAPEPPRAASRPGA